MPDDLKIRAAAPDDIPAITAIYADNVRHGTASWEYEAPGENEMRARMNALLEKGYPYLVAELVDEIAGYTYASAYRPRPGYRFTVENSVYVAPATQRRGVARRLMTELIAQCEQRGFRQMIAVIGDSGNVASIALHQSLGFTHVATLSQIGFKFDRWLDSVLMQRELNVPCNHNS